MVLFGALFLNILSFLRVTIKCNLARNLPRINYSTLAQERSKRSLRSIDVNVLSLMNDAVDGRWEKACRHFNKQHEEFEKELDRVSERIEKQWPGYLLPSGEFSVNIEY